MTLINKMNGLIYKLENNDMSFVDTNPVKVKTLKLHVAACRLSILQCHDGVQSFSEVCKKSLKRKLFVDWRESPRANQDAIAQLVRAADH